MSAYLRKMAIDRYAAKPDLLALFCKEILVAPRRISQVHIHLLCLLFSVPHVSKRHLPNGNRQQPPPCLTKSETDGRKSMAARRTVKSRFISPILTLCQGHKPRPDDVPKREFSFDEKGNIIVKNPSALWLPDVKIVEEHGDTEYTVTGSYEGTETLDKKLRRIMEQNAADDKNDITEDADE